MITRLKATSVKPTTNVASSFLKEFPQYNNEKCTLIVSRTATLEAGLRRMYLNTGLANHIATSKGHRDHTGRNVYVQVLEEKE